MRRRAGWWHTLLRSTGERADRQAALGGRLARELHACCLGCLIRWSRACTIQGNCSINHASPFQNVNISWWLPHQAPAVRGGGGQRAAALCSHGRCPDRAATGLGTATGGVAWLALKRTGALYCAVVLLGAGLRWCCWRQGVG